MKKVIIGIMIMMVINVVGVHADDNIVVEKRTLSNKNIEVVLRVSEGLEVYGGNITYSYDSSVMEIKDIMIIDDDNFIMVVNDNYNNEGNKIRVSFAAGSVIKGDILVVIFAPKDSQSISDEMIKIEQFEAVDSGGQVKGDVSKETVSFIESKGDSLIDETVLKTYKQKSSEIDNNEKNMENEKQASGNENKQTVKESSANQVGTGSDQMIIIGIIGIVILGVIGIVYFKKKK